MKNLTLLLVVLLLVCAGFVWYSMANNNAYLALVFAVMFGYNLRSLTIQLNR